jgi:hypothetical protein
LEGGSSLARLLAQHRGKRNHLDLSVLTEEQILAWADAHQVRTGDWPTEDSGAVADASDETWRGITKALRNGGRGLPGGSSLARLLTEYRRKRNHLALPDLTIEQILVWADAYYANTGTWPKVKSGAVADAPGETWNGIEHALRNGNRGLPGGSSLAQLLTASRGVQNRANLPLLTEPHILEWADAHYKRTGQWPKRDSGVVVDSAGETWMRIDNALRKGARGLPRVSSLAQLLLEARKVPYHLSQPALDESEVLGWAIAFRERTGHWPRVKSGPIPEARGETWSAVNAALERGLRGLPGGSSLARLLSDHRKQSAT